MHDELVALLEAAGGRTLALFTSWRAMHAAAANATDRVPYRVLSQDDLPKPALLRAFTDDETSCLFATMGFWQGVDVPGTALSQVIIDRLPFARPDEPLMQARRQRAGPNAFRLIDLPRAATMLAQGAGVDHILFGSDFPHPEGLAEPCSYLDHLPEGMAQDDVAKVMGGNLGRLMGVDVPVG